MAWNDPEGKWAKRTVLQIGVDLLDDRLGAVCLLGLDQDQRTVGEHGVVAVES